MNKVKLFENSSIETLNAEIAAFLKQENAAIIDVKLAVNQSTYKPSYSMFVIALIYKFNSPD